MSVDPESEVVESMVESWSADGPIRVLGYDPGKKNRWAGWVDFLPGQTPEWNGSAEVGPEREDVLVVLDQAFKGIEPARCFVVVETPSGIPFGRSTGEVIARGRDMNVTSIFAERFASVAWARGFHVVQVSAAEVRGGHEADERRPARTGLCLAKSAKDAEVRAALETNVRVPGRSNVHARDAVAAALFVGASIAGHVIRHGGELLRAKAEGRQKSAAKTKRTKAAKGGASGLSPSVLRALQEQGHGDLIAAHGADGLRIR